MSAALRRSACGTSHSGCVECGVCGEEKVWGEMEKLKQLQESSKNKARARAHALHVAVSLCIASKEPRKETTNNCAIYD